MCKQKIQWNEKRNRIIVNVEQMRPEKCEKPQNTETESKWKIRWKNKLNRKVEKMTKSNQKNNEIKF